MSAAERDDIEVVRVADLVEGDQFYVGHGLYTVVAIHKPGAN